MAVAPGIPDLSDQEKRDNVPADLYVDLHRRGLLAIAEGLRVQPPAQLWEAIRERWGVPVRVVCATDSAWPSSRTPSGARVA